MWSLALFLSSVWLAPVPITPPQSAATVEQAAAASQAAPRGVEPTPQTPRAPGGSPGQPPAQPAAQPGQKPEQTPGQTPAQPGQKPEPKFDQPPAQVPEKPSKSAEEKPHQTRSPSGERRALAIDIGEAEWFLSGNERKWRQYATPPRAFFLKELLLAPLPSKRDYGFLSLRAPGELDYRDEALLALNHGRSHFEGAVWHNDFFVPSVLPIDVSHRGINEEYFKQLITRDFGISVRYRMLDQGEHFDVPRLPLFQRTRYWDAIAAGTLGPGMMRLSYTDWRYFDRTGTLLDTTVNGLRLAYMWQPTRDIGIEPSFQRLTVKQPGVASGRVETISLSADAPVGTNTDVGLLLRRDTLTVPQVKTAYAREQRVGAFGIGQSWRHWNARLAFQIRDMERVRADQSFVDVPQFFTWDGNVRGRLGGGWRLTLRGTVENLRHAPPMSIVTDTRSLYWNARQYGELRLERDTDTVSEYFNWSYRSWQNAARAVDLSFNGFVLGGTWQANPYLNLFAEYTKENWNGRAVIPGYALSDFTPDSFVITGGVTWVVRPRAYVSFIATSFGTANDNPLLLANGNTSGTYFTLNTNYEFPSGSQIGLVVAPWSYSDVVTHLMDYHSTMVMVTGKTRF